MGMKKQFCVLKDRPKIKILLTRDSVATADDFDAPHERLVSSQSFLDPAVLASHLSSGYLPHVAGIGHTWGCLLNGELIATISVEEIKSTVSEVVYASNNSVHFVYHSATF